MVRYALGLLAVILLAGSSGIEAGGGKFNKKIKIGDPAPAFKALPGVDGKMHSLEDYKDKDTLVVVITCNHCPVAVAYEGRLIDFTKKHVQAKDSKVGLVAINVNNMEADKLPKMIERAKENGFNFPYLYDESQQIARALGASVTPEVFVFDKNRKLVYTGAVDDSQKAAKVNYLEDAVQAVSMGSLPAVQETRARGCGVKYE